MMIMMMMIMEMMMDNYKKWTISLCLRASVDRSEKDAMELPISE